MVNFIDGCNLEIDPAIDFINAEDSLVKVMA